MKQILFFLPLLLIALMHSTPLLGDTQGQWEEGSHSSNGITRKFRFFTPAMVLPKSSLSPLMVMLHGCDQDIESFVKTSKMNEAAERFLVNVLYIEQPRSANPLGCWNWFKKENQSQLGPETFSIVSIVAKVLKEHPSIDREKVFVGGISAGAAMSAILATCHPEIFRGAALHSGPGFGWAQNPTEALTAMKKGPQRKMAEIVREGKRCAEAQPQVPLFIVQGSGDKVVDPVNGPLVFDFFRQLKGFGVVSKLQTKVGGREIKDWSAEGGLRLWEVKDLGHQWLGGAKGKYSEPNGPSISEAFLSHLLKFCH